MKYSILILLIFTIFKIEYSDMSLMNCVCGQQNYENIVSYKRIVNGTVVKPHKYPWMVAMVMKNSHMCGGSIISDRNILTAGHCMYYVGTPKNTYWLAGHNNIKEMLSQNLMAHRTKDYHLHPKFKADSMFDLYDIAFITVDRPFIFGRTVSPICLPDAHDDKHFYNEEVTTAGWGKMEEEGTKSSDVLLETQIYLKTVDTCKMLTNHIKYDEKAMICAHKKYTDACQGDSGGPLFVQKTHNFNILLGVVSFGDGCARDFPGIYGKVTDPHTLNWIKSMISKSNGNICMNPSLY